MKNIKIILLFVSLVFTKIAFSQDEIRSIKADLLLDQIRGEYGIWYKTSDCTMKDTIDHLSNRITKPFIICEGFDIESNNDLPNLYNRLNNANGFLLDLRRDGFDIIILNLFDNTKSITKNSRLLQKLILDINGEVGQNHNEFNTFVFRPIVMGISMGGLISRHALMEMEFFHINHQVEKLITLDTPHQGANVPLGLLNFIDLVSGPLDEFQELRVILDKFNVPDPITMLESVIMPNWKNTLHSDAAYEMAMNNPGINEARTLFLYEMQQLGNYPNRPRLVGIACGSNGQNQQGITKGDEIVHWGIDGLCLFERTLEVPVFGDVHFRICPLTFNARMWAMPGQAQVVNSVPQLNVVTLLSGGSEIGFNDLYITNGISRSSLTNRDHINAPLFRDWSVDHVPGGFEEFETIFGTLKNTLDNADIDWHIKFGFDFCDPTKKLFTAVGLPNCIPFIDVDETFKVDNILGSIEYVPQYSFVPTVSALDVNTSDWHYDFNNLGNYPHNKNMTPFDAIFWNDDNSRHASIRGLNKQEFMMSELSPNDLYIQNRVFEQGYINTFESRNTILVGRNVDKVQGRTVEGDVIVRQNTNVTLSATNFAEFEDGFEVEEGADFQVVQNNLTASACSSKFFTGNRTTVTASAPSPQMRVAKTELSKTQKTSIPTFNKELIIPKKYEAPMNSKEEVKQELSVYPNPTNGMIHFIGKGELFSLSGQKIMEGENVINLSDLSNGMYFLKIGNHLEKVIKQ